MTSNTPTSAKPLPAVEQVDASYLESLLGYNARRAALSVIEVFMVRMAPYGLRPVDFSVLSLVNSLEKRKLTIRRPHPRDGRAMGLHLTASGKKLMRNAESTAASLEAEVASRLSASESRTLIRLLQKVYL